MTVQRVVVISGCFKRQSFRDLSSTFPANHNKSLQSQLQLVSQWWFTTGCRLAYSLI